MCEDIEEYINWIELHKIDLVNEWKCIQCGQCCQSLINTFGAEGDDLERWKNVIVKSNIGIFSLLEMTDNGDTCFINPKTYDYVYRCPFLRKKRNQGIYECLIHDERIKPTVCKSFPHSSVQLICKNFQQIIKQKLNLHFNTMEDEILFFEKLSDELMKKRYI